jgi:hypothetical protein
MLTRTKHLRFLLVALMLAAVVTAGTVAFGSVARAAGAADPGCPAGQIKLNIPFGKSCVTDLADYISIFYRYMVGAIGIVGVAMIMYGGIRWVASNGNSKEVDEAKQTITSAIIGVVLALGSYVLLNFLNPMITQLEDPLKGHAIDAVDTTVFCKDSIGADWKTRVKNYSSGNDHCGQEYQETSGGYTCVSDTCSDGLICYNNMANGSGLDCVDAKTICESASSSACGLVDAQIARFQSDYGCAPRFSSDFLSIIDQYLDIDTGGGRCVYGPIITKPTDEWEVVSCLTPAAQHYCNDIASSGQRIPLDCARSEPVLPFAPEENYGNNSRVCADKSRPVAGADGICLHKIGGDLYQCFD